MFVRGYCAPECFQVTPQNRKTYCKTTQTRILFQSDGSKTYHKLNRKEDYRLQLRDYRPIFGNYATETIGIYNLSEQIDFKMDKTVIVDGRLADARLILDRFFGNSIFWHNKQNFSHLSMQMTMNAHNF